MSPEEVWRLGAPQRQECNSRQLRWRELCQQMQESAKLEAKTISYLQRYKFADALFYKLAGAVYQKAAKNCRGNASAQMQTAAGRDDNIMAYLQQYTYGTSMFGKLAAAMQ